MIIFRQEVKLSRMSFAQQICKQSVAEKEFIYSKILPANIHCAFTVLRSGFTELKQT